jgi:hypothetical protein
MDVLLLSFVCHKRFTLLPPLAIEYSVDALRSFIKTHPTEFGSNEAVTDRNGHRRSFYDP